MEIKKIEKSDYVMFFDERSGIADYPRMQHRGLVFKHVERDAFKAELRHVPGHGDYWLLHQQSKPHLVAHVQLPKSEAEFDRSSLLACYQRDARTSLAGALARTNGANTSRAICRSSASSQATMPKSSPRSTLILSASVSTPSTTPHSGGTNTEKRRFCKNDIKNIKFLFEF